MVTERTRKRHEREAYENYTRAFEVLDDYSLEIRAARDAERDYIERRDAKILEFFAAGWITQQQIAEATGLSVIRVRQIVKDQRRKRAEEEGEEDHE